MFCLAFDRAQNVLLSRFTGMLVADDIRALDEAVVRFVRDHGNVRGLLDFTDVIHVAVPESFFQARSRLPQISVNEERVFVAPHEEALALARRYASQQRDFGNRAPAVVKTMAEAYELLGMKTPNFVPVPQDNSDPGRTGRA
jgi:hypothetical protein